MDATSCEHNLSRRNQSQYSVLHPLLPGAHLSLALQLHRELPATLVALSLAGTGIVEFYLGEVRQQAQEGTWPPGQSKGPEAEKRYRNANPTGASCNAGGSARC